MQNIKSHPTHSLPLKGEGEGGVEKAYKYAIYLLGIRLRTEGELRERMKQKSYPLAVVDEVINYLKGQRFLDDLRFAQVYLDNLKKYKNFGFYGIKKKMIEKRLPISIIEQVLSEGLPVEEEIKIAKRFLAKNQSTDKNKTARHLASRGFRSDIISKMFFNF